MDGARAILARAAVLGCVAGGLMGAATGAPPAAAEPSHPGGVEDTCDEVLAGSPGGSLSKETEPRPGSIVHTGDEIVVRLRWDPDRFVEGPLHKALDCVTLEGDEEPSLSVQERDTPNDGEFVHRYRIPDDAPPGTTVCDRGFISGDGSDGGFEREKSNDVCFEVTETGAPPPRQDPGPRPRPAPGPQPRPAPGPEPQPDPGGDPPSSPPPSSPPPPGGNPGSPPSFPSPPSGAPPLPPSSPPPPGGDPDPPVLPPPPGVNAPGGLHPPGGVNPPGSVSLPSGAGVPPSPPDVMPSVPVPPPPRAQAPGVAPQPEAPGGDTIEKGPRLSSPGPKRNPFGDQLPVTGNGPRLLALTAGALLIAGGALVLPGRSRCRTSA